MCCEVSCMCHDLKTRLGAAAAVHLLKAHVALLKSAFPATAPPVGPLALQSNTAFVRY